MINVLLTFGQANKLLSYQRQGHFDSHQDGHTSLITN